MRGSVVRSGGQHLHLAPPWLSRGKQRVLQGEQVYFDILLGSQVEVRAPLWRFVDGFGT